MDKKRYESKQIAPHVLRFEHKSTGRLYFRVTFRRHGKTYCRYITPTANTDEAKLEALNIALRLSKRMMLDFLEPVTPEEAERMFDFYRNADLVLDENKTTNE